jgi:hypothetical protein
MSFLNKPEPEGYAGMLPTEFFLRSICIMTSILKNYQKYLRPIYDHNPGRSK